METIYLNWLTDSKAYFKVKYLLGQGELIIKSIKLPGYGEVLEILSEVQIDHIEGQIKEYSLKTSLASRISAFCHYCEVNAIWNKVGEVYYKAKSLISEIHHLFQ